MSDFRPVWIIPCYRHGALLQARLPALCACGLPIFVVDDGNTPPLALELPPGADVRIIRRPQNGGKGAAFMSGARAAFEAGFTHAIQLDADGQHALADGRRLIEAARCEPDVLWSGYPVYGDDVPKARLRGRALTRWIVRLETGLPREDAQCGCRAYPLAKLMAVAPTIRGRRMTFDVEVIVKWVWAGGKVKPFDVHVAYAPGGISNFRMVRDNLAFVCLHTRLIAGRVLRLLLGGRHGNL